MAILTIDDTLGVELRRRAEHHGRSMDEEAATILRDAMADRPRRTGLDLAESIRAKFAPFGDVELDIPPRRSAREPPRFEE